VDFFCEEVRLAVELDGGRHSDERQLAYDALRTQVLEEQGIRVLRFWNSDVLQNLDGVLTTILDELRRRR